MLFVLSEITLLVVMAAYLLLMLKYLQSLHAQRHACMHTHTHTYIYILLYDIRCRFLITVELIL